MCSAKSKSKKQMWNTAELYPVFHQPTLLSIIDLMFFSNGGISDPSLAISFCSCSFIPCACYSMTSSLFKCICDSRNWGQEKKGNGTVLSKNTLFYNKRSHWMPKLVMKETPSGSEKTTKEWSMMGIFKLVLTSFLPAEVLC